MTTSTNNRWFTIVILLLLTANIATLTILWMNHKGGDRRDNKPPPPQGQVFEFITNELKLDSSQQAAYSKLREEHQAGQKAIQDSMRKAKDAFFALLQQPGTDEATVQAAAKKASDAQQQMEMLTFRHFQKVRAICNPEQQKKFDTIIQDVLRRMAPARRQGPPPRRPGEDPGRFPPPPGGPGNEPPPPGSEPPPPQH